MTDPSARNSRRALSLLGDQFAFDKNRARIDQVRDDNVDDYGLPNVPLGEPEMPDFAPPDAEFSDDYPWESDR